MFDHIVKRVKRKVQKGVIPKKMKIVIVLGNDNEHQYIVQSRYYKKFKIERPGRRALVETEKAAAARLIELAVGVVPAEQDVVIVDSDGAAPSKVSYVFWFASPDFRLASCDQLQGYVLSLQEQLSLEHEWLLRAEARIAHDLFVKATEQREAVASNTA